MDERYEDEDDCYCFKFTEYGCRCRFCPCLSKSFKAGLASVFFTIMHFAVFAFLCVKLKDENADASADSGSTVLYVIGFPTALVGLPISAISIYGVFVREKKYTRPLAIYLGILALAACIGILVSIFTDYPGQPVLIISSVIVTLTLPALSNVWNPWDHHVYHRPAQNTNSSPIQQPSVKFISERHAIVRPQCLPSTRPAVGYVERDMILPTTYPSRAQLPMLGQ